MLRLTGSPTAVAAVVAAGMFGNLVLGLFAGVYVDRWDRKRVIVGVNLLQALVLLPLLTVNEAGLVWVVIVVAFAESALAKFFQPAENALLPRLVAPEHLAAANSLNSLNNNIGRLIGPALGGLAAASIGLGGAALLDAGTFAIAALLCALITGNHRADRTGDPPHQLLREFGEGLRFIGRNRIVRAIFVLIAIIMIGEGMMSTLFVLYVTRALHGSGSELGWLMSAQAIGRILGSLAATRVANRFRQVPLVATSFTLTGLMNLAIFNYPRLDTTLWPVMAMFVVVGLPIGIHPAVLWTLFQIRTPDRLRGRAFATIWVGRAPHATLGCSTRAVKSSSSSMPT